MQELIGLASFSPGSEASDGALLLHLRLLPVPTLGLSGFVLLARAWYSCSGMLILYFTLALLFSMLPSSVSELILAPAHPPLWEFFWSVMLTECLGIYWRGSRSLGCDFVAWGGFLDVYPLSSRRCHVFIGGVAFTQVMKGGSDEVEVCYGWFLVLGFLDYY